MHELKARISDEAWQGIADYCSSEGSSLTAMVEASGRLLYERAITFPPELGVLARSIDAERRSRRYKRT